MKFSINNCYWKNIENIYFYLFHAFFILLLSPYWKATNVVFMLICLVWLSSRHWQEKWKNFVSHSPSNWLFGVFALYHVVSLLYSDNVYAGIKECEKKITYLLFPIFISSINISSLKKIRLLKNIPLILGLVFVIACALASYHYFAQNNAFAFYNAYLVGFTGKHPATIGLYVNFAIFIVLEFWRLGYFSSKEKILFLYILTPLLLVFVFLQGTRLPILSLGFALFLYALVVLRNHISWKTQGSIFAGLLLFFMALAYFAPTITNRLISTKNLDIHWENTNPVNNHFGSVVKDENWEGPALRKAKAICAMDKIKQAPWFGYGIGDSYEELQKAYADRHFLHAVEAKYSVHNQFLNILMAFGFFGMAIFFLGFASSFYKAYQDRNVLYFFFVLLVFLAMTSEDLLMMHQGILFFTFFNAFLLYPKQNFA